MENFLYDHKRNEYYHKVYPEIRMSKDDFEDTDDYELQNFVRKSIEDIKERKRREDHVKKTGDVDLKKLSDSEIEELTKPFKDFRQFFNSRNPS
jgi:hypothetical protein